MSIDYVVDKPGILVCLEPFLQAGKDTYNVVHHWSWHRQHNKHCLYDGRMTIRFDTADHRHRCYLVRKSGSGSEVIEAEYKYNLCLKYCRENLTPA